jgi:restriction endonuclease S subunit
MPAINRDSLLSIKIPFPPLEIQTKIAEEVKKRVVKAEQLQKEAIREIVMAKKEVETLILDGTV